VGLEPTPLVGLREAFFDTYQKLLPRQRISAPAVVVAIDEHSLDERGQWPWPRTLVAQLMSAINAAQPAAVGVDLLFVEPDRSSPTADAALAQAIKPGKVVMELQVSNIAIAAILFRRRQRRPRSPRCASCRCGASTGTCRAAPRSTRRPTAAASSARMRSRSCAASRSLRASAR